MRLLAPRHARFVSEYLKDHNGTRAAIRAGFARNSAHVRAHRLKRRPDVSAALGARIRRRDRRAGAIAARVLEELCRVAFLDPRRFYYPAGHRHAGRLMPLDAMDEDVRGCIAHISIGGTRRNHRATAGADRVRPLDKLKALRMLYKHVACSATPGAAAVDRDRIVARLNSVRAERRVETSNPSGEVVADPAPTAPATTAARAGARRAAARGGEQLAHQTRRHRFVREYVKDLNGAKAAVRAGFRATSGKGTARRLLHRADVQAAVAGAEQRQLASAGLSVERICQELGRIAFLDIRRLYYPTGHAQAHQPIPLYLLDEERARCVATYAEVWSEAHRPDGTRDQVVRGWEIKLWNRLKALALLLNDIPRQQAIAAEHRKWGELAARLAEINRQPFVSQQYVAALRERAADVPRQPTHVALSGNTAWCETRAEAPTPRCTDGIDPWRPAMMQRARNVLPPAPVCPTHVGVCLSCQHGQRIAAAAPSVLVLCRRSFGDFRYPKYPDVSVASCSGYERRTR